MSFKDVKFDFKSGSKCKKFISIYGENGSGKTNFIDSIEFLCKSLRSFDMLRQADYISEMMRKEEIPKGFADFISFMNMSIQNDMQMCRMIECTEPTSITYGFITKGHEGYYSLSFDDFFSYEKLYYYTGKQRGTMFEIKKEENGIEMNFFSRLFENKKVEEEIRDEIEKYWGKHTFLSILQKELSEKNHSYIEDNFSPYIFDVIEMIKNISIHCKKTSTSGSEIEGQQPINILSNLMEGKIAVQNEEILNRTERILREFFTQAYADIKDVYYEKNQEADKIRYKLYVRKAIGGRVRTVDFRRESAGTQHVLEIIRKLLGAFCGEVVVYDEIDDGIHDILLKNILTSMIDDITGQLIITTHNTYLLESVDIKSVYIITIDYLGNKEIKCLDQFDRIQNTNNPRMMYLKGMFGGVPIVDTLFFDEIIEELNTKEKDARGGM